MMEFGMIGVLEMFLLPFLGGGLPLGVPPLAEDPKLAQVAPADCVYVGDDERDAIAGRAAGMQTVLAAWGYIPPTQDYQRWDVDMVVSHPSRLAQALTDLRAQTSRHRNAS